MGRLRRTYEWVDARLDLTGAQTFMGKAFPAEDSFLLGEVAVICFLVLVLTGTFLGLFFEPSTTDVEYEGSVDEYQGEEMPAAFVSVLYITYEVPFGMLIRRMHHWAAHLFVASTGLHMLRVFFTGAYRNPREPNWVVGSAIAVLAMAAAYTGYALPFDEFATTAAGIGYNVVVSIPLLGDTLGALVFGGEFPSSATVPRLYFLHVFVIPLAIGVLLAIHMGILIRQKHTEAPREADVPGEGAVARDGKRLDGPEERADGPGVDRDDDSVVVGLPAFPNQTAVTAVVFFLTMATLSLLAGFLPVHNVAEYGPNDPAGTPSLVMPDWFLMWGYGFLKLTPSWLSFDVLGIHVSSEFVGGVLLPGLVIGGLFAWPFMDRAEEPTHFTVDPLERPWQTAVGITGVVFVMIASIAGMDVLVADLLGTETDNLRPYLTGLLIVGPIVAGVLTYAILGGFGDDESGELGGDGGPNSPGGDFQRDEPGSTGGVDAEPVQTDADDGARKGAGDVDDGSRDGSDDVDERYSDADASAGDAREGPP